MKWLESFTLVMKSSITTLRERIEDPERMLHQLICDMEEELYRVRESVAGAIADEILLKRKVAKSHEEAEQWQERASASIKRGDETSAKAALEKKIAARHQAEELGKEHEKQHEQTLKLQDAVRDLEDKIRQAAQKRTLLVARLARADSTQRINSAMDRTTSHSAFAQFSRLEQRVERAEAMSDAYDRLDGRDPDAAELDRKFAAAERKQKVQDEFEELKRRVQDVS